MAFQSNLLLLVSETDPSVGLAGSGSTIELRKIDPIGRD